MHWGYGWRVLWSDLKYDWNHTQTVSSFAIRPIEMFHIRTTWADLQGTTWYVVDPKHPDVGVSQTKRGVYTDQRKAVSTAKEPYLVQLLLPQAPKHKVTCHPPSSLVWKLQFSPHSQADHFFSFFSFPPPSLSPPFILPSFSFQLFSPHPLSNLPVTCRLLVFFIVRFFSTL